MSGVPKAPAAPRLRAIREAWVRPVIGQLEADPGIGAVGFVVSSAAETRTTGATSTWSSSSPMTRLAVTPMQPDCADRSGSHPARRPAPRRPRRLGRGCARTTARTGPASSGPSPRSPPGADARLKLRYRGVTSNHAWLKRRTAALNLRNLLGKGLARRDGGWVLAT